ncbi:MAG: hypothetical protein GY832_45285 [Chloroflexi bacterium]|nr:hypothetical protein [Chloroflexota bacterium]
MKQKHHWTSGLLLLIGLTFAILGWFYFAYRQEYGWDGFLFWGIAVCSFGLLLWQMAGRGLRAMGAVSGLWIVVLTGVMTRQSSRVNFGIPFWVWLIGVCWFLLAFALPLSFKGWRQRLVDWLRRHWREVVALAVLLLAALAVRAFDLEHIPTNLGGDEGTQGVAAQNLLGPPLGNPFSTGWYSVPTMSFLAYGVSMRIFGESVTGLRALSALVGTVTVLTTFLLARELWGRKVAWLATIALACAHTHVHFSRLGSNQIFDGLFMTLSLWLLVRAFRSKRAIYFALAGTAIGMGWYGYFGARLLGIVIVCVLAWRVATEHDFLHRYGQLLVILFTAALIAVVPLALHYASHPDALMSRARQVSIFTPGLWLDQARELTGRSTASLLLEQFAKSISAFNHTTDPTFWYYATIPTLDFVSGVLFVVGLVWAMVRCRQPNEGLLLGWFWLALVLGWVITENPPSSQRMTVLLPALAMLVGLGLDWLLKLGQRATGSNWDWLAGVMLCVIVVVNLRYYFFVYTPTGVYGNQNAEVATELSRYLIAQEDNYVVHFHAPPFMYWNFGTLTFMARGVEGVDVPSVGEWPDPDLNQGVRFIFLAERLEELNIIRERYPDGREISAYSNINGRLLYVLYQVDKQQ